ncbi:MAG: amidohydrolase [Planctomycetota bacterium]
MWNIAPSRRDLLRAGSLGIAAAACSSFQRTSSIAADTVLFGGRVTTLDPARPTVDALAISGGRVVEAGSNGSVQRRIGAHTRVVELGGRRVIPGLNDSHCHAVRAGRFYNLELRWDGVTSLARGLEMIEQQAERTPAGQWVRVIGGWSPFQFAERRMPTIRELNAAAPETPVFVLFLYSQAFLNEAGVKALGLTKDTPPPKGGRYEFVDGGAILHAVPNPTILYGTIAKLPQLSLEDQLNGSRQYYRELSTFGLTSVVDAGGGGHLFPKDYGGSMTMAEREGLPVRVGMYLFPQRPGHEYEDFRAWARDYRADEQLARRLWTLSLEGAGEFLAWSAGDFENFMAPRPEQGPQMERDLERIVSFLAEVRWPFRIHATYGESVERILAVLRKVSETKPLDGLRWAIDHAETASPEQIAAIRDMGGGIAIQNRMSFAGEYFIERYGAEAARTAPPLRALVESGVPLGLGTDSTRVSSYDPWQSLQWAVSGRTVGGTELYPEAERLTREEALSLMTHGSAWFSGDQQHKGRLVEGQLADLAVLDRDYFEVPEAEIGRLRSTLTLLGGEPVWGSGAFGDLDPGAPPRPTPEWSPVRRFGGVQRG